MPDDLDLDGLEASRSFIHKTIRHNRSLLRRTFHLNDEKVCIGTTGHATFRCGSLPRARSVVEPTDEVKSVELEIRTGRNDEAVALFWQLSEPSHAVVTGTSRTWVVGVHGVVGRFFQKRQFEIPEPKPAHWRLQGWFTGVSIQIAGMVIGTGLLAMVGTAMALLR
ncbi:MAG: hypothetical protein ACRD2C_08730 [Acidimicrobiales bacterium]